MTAMGAHVQPVLLLRRGLLVLVAAACVHPGSAEAAAEEGPPEGLRLASAAEARCAASVAGGLHIPPGPDCDACASGSPNLIMEVLSDGGVYNRCLGCCVGLALLLVVDEEDLPHWALGLVEYDGQKADRRSVVDATATVLRDDEVREWLLRGG